MIDKKLLKKQPFKDKVAIICGGSKGIGKATVNTIVNLGGSVFIIARNIDALNDTKDECEKTLSESQFVEVASCDTTNMEKLKPILESFVKKTFPDYLINVVGDNHPDYVQNLKLEDFEKVMNANYYGQVVPTLIILPHFMKAKKGHIAFVSSVMGFMGMMGNATYAPSKYAIVGFAESIRNELIPYNVSVSVIYPPDTDTPLLKRADKMRPKEQFIISEKGGLLTPEQVAEDLIEGILKEKFEIFPGKAKFVNKMFRLFPNLVRSVIDKDYLKARKKLEQT